MVRAIWKDKIIVGTDNYEIIEGNVYFPPNNVKKDFLKDSDYHTICPIKGIASYYDVVVDGDVNKDAAWYYPKPNKGYEKIKDYIAFWHGVEVK